jgi:hypothetical protein
MDRREALQKITEVAGAGAVAKVVESEPKPLLFVLTMSDYQPDPDVERICQEWEAVFGGPPPAPLVILPPGADLEARVDPRN